MHSHLYQRLLQYDKRGAMRLHMPGHGGALSGFDVTELPETDDLLDPILGGALEADEREAAELFGARLTLFSAGGATLCLQTALAYQIGRLREGARVFCARDVHRSVLYALALLDVCPVFTEDVDGLLEAEVASGDLLVFSGCDYFGRVPNYAALSAFCQKNGLHTVVDNAHGTHLRFLNGGALHPLSYGFELVVDSAHKTLNCLTGAALLHVGVGLQGETELLRSALRKKMRLFSTTSPSFLILLSLTEELSAIRTGFDGENYAPFLRTAERVLSVCEALDLKRVGEDPLRIGLLGGFDFCAVADGLEKKGIVAELRQSRALVLLFSQHFTAEEAERLSTVLGEILPRCAAEDGPHEEQSPSSAKRKMSLRDALFAKSERVEKGDALGRIAAEVVGLYPPGTALCMPGEVLSREVLERITNSHLWVVKE